MSALRQVICSEWTAKRPAFTVVGASVLGVSPASLAAAKASATRRALS